MKHNSPLRALQLGNFKAFGDVQRLPLKPITLIYGPNSAGKSSLVQALALAHEATFGTGSEHAPLDVHQTTIGGNSIDLGGFRQYVHRGQAKQRVRLGVELEAATVAKRGGTALSGLFEAKHLTLSLAVGVALDDRDRPVADAEPRVEQIDVAIDDDEIMRMSRRPAASPLAAQRHIFRVDRLAADHKLFEPLLLRVVSEALPAETSAQQHAAELDVALKDVLPRLLVETGPFLPRKPSVRMQKGWSAENATSTISREIAQHLPNLLTTLLDALADTLEDALATLRYLGPLRSLPPRHLAFSRQGDADRVAGGAWAWDEVRRIDAVREKVNAWLGSERLKTAYELEVRSLVPLEGMQATLDDELLAADEDGANEMDGEYEDVARARLAARLADALRTSGIERYRELVLLDKRRNAVVTHRDVGVGISQVLPVLVLCYGSQGALLVVEQPEIHLHPALQAELADVFIQSALGGAGNTLIIETHSEHVLLRIQRRIRETLRAQEAGEPVALPISRDDVVVLYVEPNGMGSAVREMPLTESGDLAKSWPGGFFEEGLREQFDVE